MCVDVGLASADIQDSNIGIVLEVKIWFLYGYYISIKSLQTYSWGFLIAHLTCLYLNKLQHSRDKIFDWIYFIAYKFIVSIFEIAKNSNFFFSAFLSTLQAFLQFRREQRVLMVTLTVSTMIYHFTSKHSISSAHVCAFFSQSSAPSSCCSTKGRLSKLHHHKDTGLRAGREWERRPRRLRTAPGVELLPPPLALYLPRRRADDSQV